MLLQSILATAKLYVPDGTEVSAKGLAVYDFEKSQSHKKGMEAHRYTDKGAFELLVKTRAEYLKVPALLQAHYGGKVSGGLVGYMYALNHVSLWLAVACTHVKMDLEDQVVEAAREALYIGASLYEDVALCGANDGATVFVACLKELVKPNGVLVVNESADSVLDRFRAFKNMETAQLHAGPGDLFYAHEKGVQQVLKAVLDIDVDLRVARLVIRSRQINICYGDMERNPVGEEPKYGDINFLGKPLKEIAAIIGMMRRASKGILASDSNLEKILASAMDDEVEPGEEREPLCDRFQRASVVHYFGSNKPTIDFIFRAQNATRGALNAKKNQLIEEARLHDEM